MAVLTAASEVPVHNLADDLLTYKCGASVVIYKGGFVGHDMGGYAKPLVPPDDFLGIAYESVTASATAGASTVRVFHGGVFDFTLTGVTQIDVGKPVFATNDGTISLTGHPDCFVGRIIGVQATGIAKILLRKPFEKIATGEVDGVYDMNWSGAKCISSPTVLAIIDASEGLAVGDGWTSHLVGATGSPTLSYNVTLGETIFTPAVAAEVGNVGIRTPHCFNITKGIKFDLIGRLGVVGVSTTHLDFGIGALSTTGMSITQFVDPYGVQTAGYKRAAVRITSTTPATVASAYSGVAAEVAASYTIAPMVNSLTLNQRYVLIARPAGTFEIWGGSVVAGSCTMAKPTTEPTWATTITTGIFCGFFNVAKVSADATQTLAYVKNLRVSGALI